MSKFWIDCGLVCSAAFLGASLHFAAQEPTKVLRDIHSPHLPYGIPEGEFNRHDLIFRASYCLQANGTTKFPDWVAYRLTRFEVSGPVDLARNWRPDPLLDSDETLEPSGPDDYTGAFGAHQYQRGHMCPLASVKGTPYASEVNYLSNIVPQRAEMNRGPWGRLEDAVRKLVIQEGEVWVMTGPLYEREMPALPGADEPHVVPSGFWKVVMTQNHIGAFKMDQDDPDHVDFRDRITSVQVIEHLTGLRLFPLASQELETNPEWIRSWPR